MATWRTLALCECFFQFIYSSILIMSGLQKKLTADVDLQLAQVCIIIHWKLHDEVSVRRQAAGTLQVKHT